MMRWVILSLVYFLLSVACSEATFPFGFWSESATGSQCADVEFTPVAGGVTLHTPTTGAHIFYTLANDSGVDPIHTGDTAGGGTVRIGSNSGSVLVSDNGHDRYIRAVAYQSGMTDSTITEWIKLAPGP